MSIQTQNDDAAEQAVQQVLDAVDLAADKYDVDAEPLAKEVLGKVRKRVGGS